ncbi:hypothetical protein [Defluviimonas sp. SAOS-178_SWC]|uniref:hypothetical protein n=1 Tax=Defluviimonas sp. SAOS-178_SWC TaxID=3121287 RepID=UPI003221DF2E
MKIAAAILNRFSRSKAEQPDAFETRLMSMGSEFSRRNRTVLPTLFIRAGRSAA